jgi:glyoxylase-like metal-dependent hydrolase (beta-lactamase superfamily II)
MNIVKQHLFTGRVTAMELGYGIVGPPIMTVHFYHVGETLIDCGQTHMAAAVKAYVSDRRIRRVLLTHHHEDHSGNAAMIEAISGATVMGHAMTAYKMKHIRRVLPYQHLMWGQSRMVDVVPLPSIVQDSDLHFIPIHTPGHSKDHTVYLEPREGWLFSGDLYIGARIKFFRSDENIRLQIRSLKKVLEYDFGALFCAHHPVEQNGPQHLRRKLAYLEEIAGRVRDLKAKGLPVGAVIRQMDTGRDRFSKYLTMGNVSFANMIRSAYRET